VPLIPDLQAYLRAAAARTHQVAQAPPFALFFNPNDSLRFYNYAIPIEPVASVFPQTIAALRAEFGRRGRLLRFEFIEAYAPELGPALAAAGIAEESRNPLLVCTPESYRETPSVPGLEVRLLTPESVDADLAAFVDTQRAGFADETDVPGTAASETQVGDLRRRLGGDNRAFLALLQGIPVGTGMFTGPLDGFTELAGIATLPEYRRRGIATALTAFMARTAFATGVRVAFMTAADEDASRVYQRAGFRLSGVGLAFYDPQ
jgi:ribosomal protein S18 acetylase RimI-like enzyme